MADFNESLNALDHFQKHSKKHFQFLDQSIINFYARIYARIVCQMIKIKKNLKFRFTIQILIENI